eukprot:768177-Hanusia_phi.AAC.14
MKHEEHPPRETVFLERNARSRCWEEQDEREVAEVGDGDVRELERRREQRRKMKGEKRREEKDECRQEGEVGDLAASKSNTTKVCVQSGRRSESQS